MNKQIFLDGLRAALVSLPLAEIEQTLAYYEELLNDQIEDGMTEEEAIKSMEPIEVLAARTIETTPAQRAAKKIKKSGHSAPWIILIAIISFPIWFSLLGAAFAVIISIIAALFSVIITLIALVIGLGIGGIVAIVAALFGGVYGISGLLAIGGGLVALGLAALLFFPIIYLIKAIWRGIKAICHKTGSAFRRRKNNE